MKKKSYKRNNYKEWSRSLPHQPGFQPSLLFDHYSHPLCLSQGWWCITSPLCCFRLAFLWFAWILILFNSSYLPYENCQDSKVNLILSSLFCPVLIVFCLLLPLGLPLIYTWACNKQLLHKWVLGSLHFWGLRHPVIILCQKDFDSCTCFLSLLCDQMPNKKQLQRRNEAHHDGEGMMARQASVCRSMNMRLSIHEVRREISRLPGTTHWHCLLQTCLSTRPSVQKLCAKAAENPVFKHMSLCGTFDTQNTTIANPTGETRSEGMISRELSSQPAP